MHLMNIDRLSIAAACQILTGGMAEVRLKNYIMCLRSDHSALDPRVNGSIAHSFKKM